MYGVRGDGLVLVVNCELLDVAVSFFMFFVVVLVVVEVLGISRPPPRATVQYAAPYTHIHSLTLTYPQHHIP